MSIAVIRKRSGSNEYPQSVINQLHFAISGVVAGCLLPGSGVVTVARCRVPGAGRRADAGDSPGGHMTVLLSLIPGQRHDRGEFPLEYALIVYMVKIVFAIMRHRSRSVRREGWEGRMGKWDTFSWHAKHAAVRNKNNSYPERDGGNSPGTRW